jgi:hypothetical protein
MTAKRMFSRFSGKADFDYANSAEVAASNFRWGFRINIFLRVRIPGANTRSQSHVLSDQLDNG